MRRAITAGFLASILVVSGFAFGQERSFKVVGNSGTTPETVSKRDLARIFLKRKTSWPDGQAALPVDQARNDALRETFGESVLDKSLERVESYWQAQVFSGKGTPPKGLNSDAEVIEYVRRWPGAVGYVSPNASTDGVKVINITD